MLLISQVIQIMEISCRHNNPGVVIPSEDADGNDGYPGVHSLVLMHEVYITWRTGRVWSAPAWFGRMPRGIKWCPVAQNTANILLIASNNNRL